MKIVVLAGGLSPERDVSLSSGALIANALLENGHDVMLLDLYLGSDNKEMLPEYRTGKTTEGFSYTVPPHEPDLTALKQQAGHPESLIGTDVLKLCAESDLVFLALHGATGENGQLQALLDVHGIRYTGTGYIGSLLAMDKDISKQILTQNDITTPNWHRIQVDSAAASVGIIGLEDFMPCVVKPCSCGSSVGVTIAETSEALQEALVLALKYEDTFLLEEKIEGREFSVGILNGKALPVIEIKPLSGFYDYKNKYQKGLTKEICPAQVSPREQKLLQDTALKVHQVLHLGFYSRVDFILDTQGHAHCLEANTLPGMTPTSLLPQEALAAGISYNELCQQIALAAFSAS